jgi:signal transduction histidine kinase
MAVLEEIIETSALRERPSKKPTAESVVAAFEVLARQLASDPENILQTLVETAIDLCGAGSVGISIAEHGCDPVFRWKAVAGRYSHFMNNTLPRYDSPCGVVLDREQPVLMTFPERYYRYLETVTPRVEEVLLVPFAVKGVIRGTLWAVSHSAECRFCADDLETLKRLSAFAAAGYQAHLATVELTESNESLRKLHDELQLADQRKDDFLTILSHELRTPLTAILGWSQIIQRDAATPEDVRQAAATIQRNAHHQAELIEDLIDRNRILSGKLSLSLQPLDLTESVDAALDSIAPSAREKNITLRREVDPQAHVILGDQARIQQCIWNLLTNALKFTPAEGTVQVRLRRLGSEIEISVQDSGIGIAPDFLGAVFDRFSQVDATATRKHGGLGLGLPIVKSLVELHRGRVAVTSDGLGLGSTFCLFIPAASDQKVTTHQPGDSAAAPATDLSKARILLVDDDADTRDVIARILRREGATVEVADSAAEGLRLIAETDYDLLLSDVAMPDMDGYEFLRQVRQLETAGGKKLPAVALTAHVRSEERATALRAGYDRVLAKPIEVEELIAVAARIAG